MDENISNEELNKQLNILNLSFNTLIVIFFAIYLNMEYVNGERVKILDELNNTNLSDKLPDFSGIPIISNRMFIVATSIFLFINYDAYKGKLEKNDSEKNIQRSFKAFISSVLIVVATSITSSNLEV